MVAKRRMLAVVAWIVAGCGPAGSSSIGPPGFEGRPYTLEVAPGHDATRATALLLVLHGYGSTGRQIAEWWQLSALARARNVLIAHPEGRVDASGRQYWNATDACCDMDHAGVDDVGYLRAIIADVSTRYAVDPGRVYVTGHSNGGYMAHRMGCDAADVVAAIAPVSGVGWKDPSRCRPSAPMPVLEIMGTRDGNWSGGPNWPSSAEDMANWAAIDGCSGELMDTGERLDLVAAAPGVETRVSRHDCAQAAVEQWAMVNVEHVFEPRLPAWGNAMLDWLEAHRR